MLSGVCWETVALFGADVDRYLKNGSLDRNSMFLSRMPLFKTWEEDGGSVVELTAEPDGDDD